MTYNMCQYDGNATNFMRTIIDNDARAHEYVNEPDLNYNYATLSGYTAFIWACSCNEAIALKLLEREDLNYNKRPICKTYICALQNACERKFDAIVLKLLEKPDLDRTGITWNNIRYITSLANEQNPLHIVI
jgi:hypothetical protein